jgi:hypothetical protein
MADGGVHGLPPDAVGAELAQRWAELNGLADGTSAGPPQRHLMALFGRWCESQGLDIPSVRALGRGLARHGLRVRDDRNVQMSLTSVRKLWAELESIGISRPPKANDRRPRPPVAPRFWDAYTPKARAICDSTGRVYPSITWAAKLLGVSPKNIPLGSMARARRQLAGKEPVPDEDRLRNRMMCRDAAGWAETPWAGRLWRYLTPEELKRVPKDYTTGQPCLRWRAELLEEPDDHVDGGGI